MKEKKSTNNVTRRSFGKMLAGAGAAVAASKLFTSPAMAAAPGRKRTFLPSRYPRFAMSRRDTIAALVDGQYGVIASVNADGFPVGTPVSYVYKDNQILFHTAQTPGEKTNNMAANPDVCFTIVNYAIPSTYKDTLGTLFKSVMVFGRATLVTDEAKRKDAMVAISTKYLPTFTDKIDAYYDKFSATMDVYSISMDHVSGLERGEKHY